MKLKMMVDSLNLLLFIELWDNANVDDLKLNEDFSTFFKPKEKRTNEKNGHEKSTSG